MAPVTVTVKGGIPYFPFPPVGGTVPPPGIPECTSAVQEAHVTVAVTGGTRAPILELQCAQYLGVTQLSRQAVVARHVLPRASELPESALAAVVLPVLKQLSATPQAVPEAVKAAVWAAACVPTAAGGMAKPGELYDPRSQELKCLLGPAAPFPAESWASEAGVLEGLAGVGMRSSLGPEVLLEVAKDIEAASLALPPHAQEAPLLDRGQALLAALATLSAAHDVAAGTPSSEGSQPGQASSGGLPPSLWSQLAVVAFVPVYTQPPCEGLPWPSGSNLPLAPPKLVRPEGSMWLVSASMRILAASGKQGSAQGGWACPDHLAARLGWLDPPPVSVLAAQLLELSRLHGAEGSHATPTGLTSKSQVDDPQLQATLAGAVTQLYGLLAAPERLGGQEGEVARVMLEGSAWVWTGEGFQAVDRVALDSPADFRPYLHTVPEDLLAHEALFTALGVPATPTPDQYRHALARLASASGDQPLPETQLALALALAEGLAAALVTDQAGRSPSTAASSPPAFLPDSAAVMAPAASLHYDDAPWLGRAGLRMVHASLAVEVAQALGAQSLRYHHQVDTQMTSTYPCTPAALIRQLLEQQKETGLLALYDVLEVADACGCTKAEFFLDECDYPAQSLLQPELAAFQGPAICIALEGVVLSAEEVCRLQVPTTPFRLRHTLCGYGAGLMGAYALTDLPMVLAGDSLLMADPAGAHLSTPGATGGTAATQAATTGTATPAQAGAGVIKQYRHAGSDLPSRFADQFSVWRWAGEGPCEGAQVGATLVRLPLRTEAQAAAAAALRKAAWSQEAALGLLDQLSASLPQCLLFLRSLRTVRVLRHTSSGAQLVCEATILQGERGTAGAAVFDPHQMSHPPSHRVWVDERDWRRKAATNSVSSSSGRSSGSFFGRLAKLASGGGSGGTPKAGRSGSNDASSSGTTPANAAPAGVLRHTQHQVVVKGADGAATTQLWAVAAYAAAGQVAQLGSQLQLSPQAAVAVRLGGPTQGSRTALEDVRRHDQQQQQQQQSGGCITPADGGHLHGPREEGPQAPNAALAVVKSPGLLSPLPLYPSSELGRLPSTLCATFALARSGGRRLFSIGSYNEELAADSPSQLKPRFNMELLRCAAHAWVALLESLLQQHQGASCRDLYAMLPRCGPPESCQDPETAFLVQQVYSLAARRPVWQVRAGQLLSVAQGCFLDAGEALSLSGPAREFVQQLFPLFDVPGWLKDQLEACGVSGLRSVTPPVVRDVLKRMAAEGRLGAQVYTPAVAADLQRFCTSDLTRAAPNPAASSPRRSPAPPPSPALSPINIRGPSGAQPSSEGPAGAAHQLELDLDALRDCRGLPVITAGGRVRLLGSGRLLVWESPGEASSPLQVFAGHPPVLDEILHPDVAQTHAALLDVSQAGSLLSVEKYSLGHAASHLASVLPAHWAPPGIGRPAPMTVAWSNGSRGGPPPDWLNQLWELLLALQPDLSGPAWDPLSGWALLPCTTGDMLRLAHRHAVITPPVQQASGGASSADTVREGLVPDEAAVRAGHGSGEQREEQQQEVPQLAAGSSAMQHLEAPASAGPEGGPRFEEPWESQLAPALAKMGCFVLNPRYNQCAPLCNSAYAAPGQQAAGPADQLQLLVRKLRATTDLGRLRVSALDDSDRQVVLDALGRAVATASPVTGSLLPADIDFLRSLALFPTLAGGRVSLEAPGGAFGAPRQGPAGACSEQDVAAVFGSVQAVPLEVKERLLSAQPQLQPLYQKLSIPQLPPPSLILEALRMVGFAGLAAEARPAVLAFLDTHWEQLQGQAGALEVLQTASFVETAGGELAAPSSLYDPSNTLLTKAFAGQQNRFPAASFGTSAWLQRLREAGLKQTLDAEAVLAAARGIAARAEGISRTLTAAAAAAPAAGEVPQAPGAIASTAVLPSSQRSWLPLVARPGQRLAGEAIELWEAACGLAGCLADGSSESAALLGGGGASRAFAEELRQVAFVPARLYVPAAPVWQPVLSRYQDCLAPKDWALAWSAAPILHPCGEGAMTAGGAGGLPPSGAWSMLRLRSPPPFDAILQHLQKVGEGHGEAALSAWPSPDLAPEQACEALLKYLHDEGLSAAQRQRLDGAAFVPVANATRMASPGELFVRLPVDLAPLLWEVPPEFMPHLPLLKSLGTRDAPSPQDLLSLLASLHKPHATQPLTSVQLRGVINLLKQLLDDSTAPLAPETRQAVQAGRLPVPTSASLLAPAGQCLYASSAGSRAIMSRLAPGTLTLAHPQLPASVCRALGMHPLHDVVREELDSSQLLQPLAAIHGTTAADVAARLCSTGFAAAVHSVLRVAVEAASSGGADDGDSKSSLAVGNGGEGQQLREEAVRARIAQAAGVLQFVQQCSSLLVVSQGGSSGEASAPLQGSSTQVPYFVSQIGGRSNQAVTTVVVADLPPGIPLSASLAAVITRVLLGSTAPCLPLAPLFNCALHDLPAVASIITGAGAGSTRAAQLAGGGQGSGVAGDLEAQSAAGQMGAVLTATDATALRLRPLRPFAAGELVAFQAGTELRYGRIAADSRPAQAAAAYRLTVEVSPGAFQDLLSSELYSFGACQPSQAAAGQQGALQLPTSHTFASPGPSQVQQGGQPDRHHGPAAASSRSQEGAPAQTAAVPAAELVAAAQSMLAAAGIPLASDQAGLMSELATLQQQVEGAQRQLAQVAEANRTHQEEADNLRASWQCRVCLERQVDTVMNGCGHLLCEACSKALPRRNTCPFCRQPGQPMRIYK